MAWFSDLVQIIEKEFLSIFSLLVVFFIPYNSNTIYNNLCSFSFNFNTFIIFFWILFYLLLVFFRYTSNTN